MGVAQSLKFLELRSSFYIRQATEHHVTLEVSLCGVNISHGTHCRFEVVVVEVRCSATKEAVVAACRAGQQTPWPLRADQELINSQTELIMDAIEVLST